MSPLTKLFVSLMIVCSLLLTGGVVVFVNNADAYKQALDAETARVRQLEVEKSSAEQLARLAEDREKDSASRLNSQIAKLTADLQTRNQDIARLQGELTAEKNKVSSTTAQNTAQAQALRALTENLAALQGRHDALVKEVDTIRIRNTELVSANNDYQKRLDAAERERRWLNEQIVQIQAEVDRLTRLAQEHHIATDRAVVAIGRPAADIRGVVKGVLPQGGRVYATISLGSADRVGKGMQFIVVNTAANKYLATITLQTIDSTESFGYLDGPDVAAVKAGDVVVPMP